MTYVMCSPWKKIFTLMPLTFLTMFSPFCYVIIKETMEDFVHCLYLCYNYFFTN
jgi:hypothetical protein